MDENINERMDAFERVLNRLMQLNVQYTDLWLQCIAYSWNWMHYFGERNIKRIFEGSQVKRSFEIHEECREREQEYESAYSTVYESIIVWSFIRFFFSFPFFFVVSLLLNLIWVEIYSNP